MGSRIKLKSEKEILFRLRELVSRYRRRFLRRNLRPCPQNCRFAEVLGRKVVGCPRCGSRNPEFCKNPNDFIPMYSKDELAAEFRKMLNDPQILIQDYRDIVAFLFVLGQFDEPGDIPENILTEQVRKKE